jgi:sugar phosphate permease
MNTSTGISESSPNPTGVRHQIIGITMLVAFTMYLDRICIAEIAKLDDFRNTLLLSEKETGAILSAFFFTYALGQVPAGWLSDRLGSRIMLPVYIVIWSICTMFTGLANGFAMLFIARMLFGFAQAGCYPTASSLIKRWIPSLRRGTASSLVSFGGRLGGATAPLLTAWLLRDILGWRGVLIAYGLSGLLVALLFRKMVREKPSDHPACNQAEIKLVDDNTTLTNSKDALRFPSIMPLLKSGPLWCMCSLQFGINIGWVFLVTWLPKYLKDVKQVDPGLGGLMSTLVLFAGIVGTLSGGPLTDFSVRKLGKRWGRSIPMIGSYALAIVAYLSCLQLESAWAFIAAASVVAFATDLSVPGIWAYMQDIGGKNPAAVFGWGNMWGNFGAATTPLLVPIVLEKWDANGDWHEAFIMFSAGYVVAAIAALLINAERTVE